jgi:hypothetical protein
MKDSGELTEKEIIKAERNYSGVISKRVREIQVSFIMMSKLYFLNISNPIF